MAAPGKQWAGDTGDTVQAPSNETSPLQQAAVAAFQGLVVVSEALSEYQGLAVAVAAALIVVLVSIIAIVRFVRRSSAPPGMKPLSAADKKELEKLNTIAKARAAAYVARFVNGGINNDAFFKKDAKVPPALSAATNRFAIKGSAAADDDDDDDTGGASIAAVMARLQARDTDGSEEPVALLITADDASVGADAPGAACAGKLLNAHVSAKKLTTTLESAGYICASLSTLGDNYPYQTACGSILKQMQLAKRKFRSTLLVVTARARLVPLPKWPDASELKTDVGKKTLTQRAGPAGRDADYIFEVLVDPNAPDAASSWADLAVLLCRIAQVADCPTRPTALLNLAWESDDDRQRAASVRDSDGVYSATSDPDGFLAALHAGSPQGALAGISVIAAPRAVADIGGKTVDVLPAIVTDGIKTATATANRSAALGIAAGPSSRQLAADSPVHCGTLTADSLAEFLLQRRRKSSSSGGALAAATPSIAVSLATITPPPLSVHPVAGPRGGSGLFTSSTPVEFGDRLEQLLGAVGAATRGEAPPVTIATLPSTPDAGLTASRLLRLVAWAPSLSSGQDDNVYHLHNTDVAAEQKLPDVAWREMLMRAVDLLLGHVRPMRDQDAVETLFIDAFGGTRAVFVIDTAGDAALLKHGVAAAASLSARLAKTEAGKASRPAFVFASSSDLAPAANTSECACVDMGTLAEGDVSELLGTKAGGPASSPAIRARRDAVHLMAGLQSIAPTFAADLTSPEDVAAAAIASLSPVQREVLSTVYVAQQLVGELRLPLPCNTFSQWLGRALLEFEALHATRASGTADSEDAETNVKLTHGPSIVVDERLRFQSFPPSLQSHVAGLMRRRIIFIDTIGGTLTLHLNPLVAEWCRSNADKTLSLAHIRSASGTESPAALLFKCADGGGALSRHMKRGKLAASTRPGPTGSWATTLASDGFCLPHIVRILPTAANGPLAVWTLKAFLNSAAAVSLCAPGELHAALRARLADAKAAKGGAADGGTAPAVDTETLEVVQAAMRSLAESTDVVSATPAEVHFQFAARAPRNKPLLNPEDVILSQYVFRGDDDAVQRVTNALDVAIPLSSTIDASAAVIGPHLDGDDDGNAAAAVPPNRQPIDDGETLGDDAVTAAAIVRDPQTGKFYAAAGTAGGDVIFYGDAGACGLTVPVDDDGYERMSIEMMQGSMPRSKPAARVTRASGASPHKAPIVAVFVHQTEDGARLVTASKKDRTIAVWPAVDLGSVPEAERRPESVVDILPPAANKPAAGADDDEEEDDEDIPEDCRPFMLSATARTTVGNTELLRDRLPERFEGDYASQVARGRRPRTVRDAPSGVLRGDAVLLYSSDDNLNEKTYPGERVQPFLSSFTFSGSTNAASSLGVVTSASIVELPSSAMDGHLGRRRGFFGLMVGFASGHVAVFALGALREN